MMDTQYMCTRSACYIMTACHHPSPFILYLAFNTSIVPRPIFGLDFDNAIKCIIRTEWQLIVIMHLLMTIEYNLKPYMLSSTEDVNLSISASFALRLCGT